MGQPLPDPIVGLDEAWAKADPERAAKAGYHFVSGYISQDNTGKNLTRDEVTAIHAAGLPVVLNFEYNPQSAVGGAYAGTQDALIAVREAQKLGAPRGVTIYFSIDFPVGTGRALSVVGDYLAAAAQVCAGSGYRVGVYGGIVPVSYLLDHGITKKAWQTYAWSNGEWDPRAVLRQVVNGVIVAGAEVDKDLEIWPDYGQWNPDGSVGAPKRNEEASEVDQWLAVDSDGQHYLCNGFRARMLTPDDATTLAYMATEPSGPALTLGRSVDGQNNAEWTWEPSERILGIVRLGYVPAMGVVDAPTTPAPAPTPDPSTPTEPEQQLLDLWGRIASAVEAIAGAQKATQSVPAQSVSDWTGFPGLNGPTPGVTPSTTRPAQDTPAAPSQAPVDTQS